MTARPAALAALWAAALAALVLALVPVPGLASLQNGLLSPLLAPAHVLALVGLGLLVGQASRGARIAILTVFAAAILAGIGAIMAAYAFTEGALVLVAVAGAAGLLVALARPAPMPLAVALAAVGGVALAFDSVPHEISIAATLYALAGSAIAATLIVILVAVHACDLGRPWHRIGVRIAGSWIAASAILVLALRLAR